MSYRKLLENKGTLVRVTSQTDILRFPLKLCWSFFFSVPGWSLAFRTLIPFPGRILVCCLKCEVMVTALYLSTASCHSPGWDIATLSQWHNSRDLLRLQVISVLGKACLKKTLEWRFLMIPQQSRKTSIPAAASMDTVKTEGSQPVYSRWSYR